ncbi:MAG: 4-(cytidine 5'-diphospho)-2-C-methyl-D-erythritol kinase [bacterium]
MDKIKLYAPAKINLSLDITGIKKNGYHELEMIMQSISLYDIIIIEKKLQGINLEVNHRSLSTGKDNLVYQAAETLLKETKSKKGVNIYLDKNIPVAAGLGGGSSDAAAVLKGINRLYNINYSKKKLKKMGKRIGTDVPFFIDGGTALATGMGEEITQLPDIFSQKILLINPDIQVKTKNIYREYDNIKPEVKIPTFSLVDIIKNKKEIHWDEGWNNILEPVTNDMTKDIAEIKRVLKEKYNIKFCLMTGSGPTVFAIIDNWKIAREILTSWPRKKDKIFLTATLSRNYIF